MPLCNDCAELNGKSRNVSAHGNLELIDRQKHTGAMAVGAVLLYRCKTCRAKMQCDDDRNDDHAGWVVMERPTG